MSFQCLFQSFAVDIAGEVDRAFAVNGIPSCRVGTAEELYLKAYASGGFFDRAADNFADRLPGGSAGRTPFDSHGFNFPFRCFYIELRGAEPFTIFTQTILPGKNASGGRGGHTVNFHFFT